ncbi:hypothetical protein N7E81_04395 [Reichenbachiella carrageenanivorans]|uniref:DUF2007 domain-containing protein n=1 Tax=Reichenbachiella carrageenanivorans TaxID=2979869 RepID=A0ABY6D5J8_9BACT|nr:hypothetical protein [Reichenbachiella carrageenanivorans]UXX80338.1 hypothetical protein N7E81_04395 [Reichenbachiella carrageenanivorans]
MVLSPFRTYTDPLDAEELIDVLQTNHIPFERTFEKSSEADDYIGSNPFDSNIVIRIAAEYFDRANEICQGHNL